MIIVSGQRSIPWHARGERVWALMEYCPTPICVVQPDAPPWRDCLCYCNPCWLDHGSEWDDDDDDDNNKRPTQKSMMHDDLSLVGLSSRLSEAVDADTFTLPQNYDAQLEYERQFGEFDTASGNRRPESSHATRLSNTDETFRVLRRRLEEGDAAQPPKSLYTDFDLYVTFIRHSSNDMTARERRDLIESYERYRHKYRDCRVCVDDEDVAQRALEQARDRHANNETRLACFRKAIFFTHHLPSKMKIMDEYRAFCDSIKLSCNK